MSTWNLVKPPEFYPNAIKDIKGWINPTTGELLVSIRNLIEKNFNFLDLNNNNLLLTTNGRLKFLQEINGPVLFKLINQS